MNTRFLTKSRFNLAMDCPTKLFYVNKPEYPNHNLEDPFLQSLAEGGFQVGELAKCYFPNGNAISSKDYLDSLSQTNELLKKDKVIIYEAAFCFNTLFIRVDILVKNGMNIELIEVKAKSYDKDNDSFTGKNGSVKSAWMPYLQDVAFQKYVLQKAMPQYRVNAYLMLADKCAVCKTDGLNQKFLITKGQNSKKTIKVSKDLSDADISDWILTKISVDKQCEIIYNMDFGDENDLISYSQLVNLYADAYKNDIKISTKISSNCKSCEFCTDEEEKRNGLLSGFEECWKNELGWNDEDFKDSNVLELWNYRRKNELIADKRIKFIDITEDDILPEPDGKAGISTSERQWIQIKKVQDKDKSLWIDRFNLANEMDKWIYPLHFIDFETTMAAIPFNKGRHPYEGVAFQFSHHIVKSNGTVEHIGQYLNIERGKFPNYDFICNLKKQLENDSGSIFRYAAHENTFLNIIYRQLMDDADDISDRKELCEFIKTITKSVSGSVPQWTGSRNMIDMCELVKRYYYDPAMKGSNSIKKVLPAILNSSEYLHNKYQKPNYGADDGIKSLNYKDWRWIEYEGNNVKDPYKLLPKLFTDISDNDINLLISDSDELKDGEAALTAYARLQFEEMSDYERSEICAALLKYCELDTMAMVMIYEGWKDILSL